MSKIDIDKFVAFEYKRQLQFTPSNAKNYLLMAFDKALKEQGLCYKDGEIIEIESKPANSFQISKDLQESEDEKIRKELILFVKGNIQDEESEQRKDYLAWLEKQKIIDVLDEEERKFADDVDSYRKDMDEFYKKGYNAGREAEKQDWLEKQTEQKPTEVAESEDEKIRKAIVNAIHNYAYRLEEKIPTEWLTWLEKQGEQKPVNVKPHLPDGSIAYDRGFEEAQEYLSERGFDIPWNDCDVFVDERYITQTIANVLTWGDEHPKQKIVWPRFSVGDEIRLKGSYLSYIVKEVSNNEYRLEDYLAITKLLPISEQDNWELIGKLIDTPVWTNEDDFQMECVLKILHDDAYLEYRNWLKSIKQRIQKGE